MRAPFLTLWGALCLLTTLTLAGYTLHGLPQGASEGELLEVELKPLRARVAGHDRIGYRGPGGSRLMQAQAELTPTLLVEGLAGPLLLVEGELNPDLSGPYRVLVRSPGGRFRLLEARRP